MSHIVLLKIVIKMVYRIETNHLDRDKSARFSRFGAWRRQGNMELNDGYLPQTDPLIVSMS